MTTKSETAELHLNAGFVKGLEAFGVEVRPVLTIGELLSNKKFTDHVKHICEFLKTLNDSMIVVEEDGNESA